MQNLNDLNLLSFLLFYIKQIMNEEHSKDPNLQSKEVPKRRRTPSQYASHIADFKNNASPNLKRPRSVKFVQPNGLSEENQSGGDAKPLICTLPNGKCYNLTIVASSSKKNSIKKKDKKQQKKEESSVKAKPMEQKKQDANICLLDKLLSAFQNLQKEEEKDSSQDNDTNKNLKDHKASIREERARVDRQRQDKWTRFYERSSRLRQRLEQVSHQYVFLI